jgi:hypothetical protein
VATWNKAAGDEHTRFHRNHDSLLPVNAKGIVTNFHQADTNQDGKISRAEFLAACKLGLVDGNGEDVNIVADEVY